MSSQEIMAVVFSVVGLIVTAGVIWLNRRRVFRCITTRNTGGGETTDGTQLDVMTGSPNTVEPAGRPEGADDSSSSLSCSVGQSNVAPDLGCTEDPQTQAAV